MMTKERRAERIRRHEDLKGYLEAKLAMTESESDREYLIARIAEVECDIEATKLPEVTLSESKALLPEITKTAEEDTEKAEEDTLHPQKQKPLKPKSALKKINRVGNPF